MDLWFDRKHNFPMKTTAISGKDAGQIWPSNDTEGQRLPEALTGVAHLEKIPFVLMSKNKYIN